MLVPRPQLGRHNTAATPATAFVLVPLTVAADGTLSVGTLPSGLTGTAFPTVFGLSGNGVSLRAQRRGNSWADNVERSEINSASSRIQNEVILSEGITASLEIFAVNNGTDPNPLRTLTNNFDYFMLVWIMGTATGSIETQAIIGVRGNLDTSMQGRGETIATFELGPCDPGVAPYAYAVN
jgi:hypothetical protein